MTIEYSLNEFLSLQDFTKILEEGTVNFNIPTNAIQVRATPMPGFVCEILCDPEDNHSLISTLIGLSVSRGFQLDDLAFRESVPGIGTRRVIIK